MRERPRLQRLASALITAAGFVVRVTAVVEGEVCGYCLWGVDGGVARDIELAQAHRVSVAKAALSRADATRHGGEQEPQDCCAFRANRSQPE